MLQFAAFWRTVLCMPEKRPKMALHWPFSGQSLPFKMQVFAPQNLYFGLKMTKPSLLGRGLLTPTKRRLVLRPPLLGGRLWNGAALQAAPPLGKTSARSPLWANYGQNDLILGHFGLKCLYTGLSGHFRPLGENSQKAFTPIPFGHFSPLWKWPKVPNMPVPRAFLAPMCVKKLG